MDILSLKNCHVLKLKCKTKQKPDGYSPNGLQPNGYSQRINSWFGKSNLEILLETSGKDNERERMWEKSRNMNDRNSYVCHYLCTRSLRTTGKK